MIKNLVVFFILAVSVFCLQPAFGQDQGAARGNLGGVVVDSSGAVVEGAKVTITGPIGTDNRTTGDQGDFLFSTLVPGSYTVKVEKDGFSVATVNNIQVGVNSTATIRVPIQPGAVTQSIEVVASVLTVDSTTAAVNANLADTFYQNVPLNRGVASIFYLSPGVTSGLGTGQANPSISGATGLENLYVADGVMMNDSAFGGLGVFSRVYGPLGSGINLSFVKEVQVKSAGFEPQYGHSTGGIVQIVTKSGGTETHGVIGGYFQAPGMSSTYKNNDDFHPLNRVGRELHQGSYEGDFELGGHVPGFKNRLFYFGTFNPTWNTEVVAPALGSGLFAATPGGQLNRDTTIWDYAAKLTFKLNDRNTVESSVFGDPSHTLGFVPLNTLNIDNNSANSKWNLGTRNWAVRYNGAFGADWLVNAAFSWNWNHFDETPAQQINQITDLTQTGSLPGQRGSFTAQGLGLYEPYDSENKSIEGDTQKGYNFGGRHTFSLGYTYSRPSYDDDTERSGPRFAIPAVNSQGNPYLSSTQAFAAGQMTNATFNLQTSATCTVCPLMTIPGFSTPQPVYLKQSRGTFSNPVTHSTGRYHSAFANDSWQMGTHVTFSAGLRWEEQRINGNAQGTVFTDQWSPRIALIVDPKGDRKSKLYASYGRYAYVVPLDLALRELSSEQDYRNACFAPASSGGKVTLNSLGTVTPVLDAAHLINNVTGSPCGNVTVSVTSGEGFAPQTRMEYNDEFVVGGEHEFRGGIVVSARYIDRRLKRIIEDFWGGSLEAADAGLTQSYLIGNPSGSTDLVINPSEFSFSGVDSTAMTAAIKATWASPTAANDTALKNLGFPASCIDASGRATNAFVLNELDTFGHNVGSACFAGVNAASWVDSAGKTLTGVNFGGGAGSDGKVDGFNDPKREYQAIEFEVNKSMSHNWAILANWRISRLQGNFEGAFRNDNNQSDPGISSLYDFTPGLLGLLGQQQGIGLLNSDRKHVVNVYTTYILDRSFMKGLVLGSGLRLQTGVPLTTLAAQKLYVNSGEVPIFGRGDLGRAPVTGTVDAHAEYPLKITERLKLNLGVDLFNIANTKRALLENQFVDLSFGVLSPDFKKPGNGTTHSYPDRLVGGFVAPFSMRALARLEF